MKKSIVFLGLFIFVIGHATLCIACTTFVLADDSALLFARNLDWGWGDGIIVVNNRGIEKTAYVRPSETPTSWTSKYGSVTFNQLGREMPFGGMNETGLVVEVLILMDSKYPDFDDRPAVNHLQWVQYQLDNCRTVEEVLATDEQVRLETPLEEERIHYLICDASGDTATIEFLNGEMVCHRDENLTSRALTNNTYRESVEFSSAYAASSNGNSLPTGSRSIHRFARAAKCSREFQSRSPEQDREYAFHHLDDVAQDSTMWSIVYDIPRRKVFYRTSDNPKLRWFSLADFDFEPSETTLSLDINASGEGGVSQNFEELSDEQHEKYLMFFVGRSDFVEDYGDRRPYFLKLSETVSKYRPRTQKQPVGVSVR